ncbi:uncharacterized protein LOC108740162 [Agrilus planipennis]|uniref:Uncharacterized protein LOC108740162 n=1 Tax=Agrilus planipennis TaxID=224129 RepID=A0A7F5RFX8_AGRPL|nr:uncharacterized protein LOC108740162 [Agrilus planipennis]
MNTAILLGLIACICFTSASILKAENEDETRSILSNTINRTVESLRVQIANYDPLLLTDKSISVSELGDINVKKVEVSGFSNFALTSLSANALTSNVGGTLSLPKVSANIQSATLSSEALDVEAEVTSLSVELVGATVEFSFRYSVRTLQLTSLSIIPKIQGLDLELRGFLNGQASELIITSEEIVDFINEFLSDYQDAISSALQTGINYLLRLVGSPSS